MHVERKGKSRRLVKDRQPLDARHVDCTDLWKEYRQNPTVELRNRLAEFHYYVLEIEAKKFRARCHVDLDELIQMGTINFLRAVEKFDPSLGFKFETYGSLGVALGIRTELRKWRRNGLRPIRGEAPSVKAFTVLAETNSDSTFDYDFPDYRRSMDWELIRHVASTLNREKRPVLIFLLRFVEGWTFREIGETIGTSSAAAWAQWKTRVVPVLKEALRSE